MRNKFKILFLTVFVLCVYSPKLFSQITPWKKVELIHTKYGSEFGGISAISYENNKLILLSDDRGKKKPVRWYEAKFVEQITSKSEKVKLEVESEVILKNISSEKKMKQKAFDMEGIAFHENIFWLSSEADTNLKPRGRNRLLGFNHSGEFLKELSLPEEIQPNELGQQKKGTYNNRGPEGLTSVGDTLWVAMEAPLVQENWNSVSDTAGATVPFYQLSLKTEASKVVRFDYQLDKPINNEVFRGISEILAIEENVLLVLERSVSLHLSGIRYGGGLYKAICTEKKCIKEKWLDLDSDLVKFRDGEKPPNYEGLAWGPTFEGTRTILLVSDNNFSSDKTEVVLLKYLGAQKNDHMENKKGSSL